LAGSVVVRSLTGLKEQEMAPNGNNSNFLSEYVTFIQHHLPGLDAGSYNLLIQQSRTDNKKTKIGEDLSRKYKFAVKGDRFAMSVPSDIYAVFPPNNAAGEFKTVLPHVVFTKKTYPWIRYPNNEEPTAGLKPGETVDKEVPTWLTILLFDEDDGLSPDPQLMTTNDLFPAQLGPNVVSYFADDNVKNLNYGEQLTDPVRVLDIPLTLFWKLAPSLSDLNYMAHARQVSLLPKTTMQGISDIGEPLGDFSIVFGNRLPQAGKRSYAFLVSLEGLENYLPDDDGNPKPAVAGNANKFLRLAVLKNWQFDSLIDSPAAFVNAVQRLNNRKLDDPAPASLTTLQLPHYSGPNEIVRRAVQMGYAPLNNNLRTGEKTVSWYRGPLVPYQMNKSRISLPLGSPDQATIFDPTTGMFDVSYAIAWTLGRQLALQDSGFSIALYEWKKGVDLEVIRNIENNLLKEKFGSLLQLVPKAFMLEATATQKPNVRKAFRRTTLELLLKSDRGDD
jgi:hypothetical protein